MVTLNEPYQSMIKILRSKKISDSGYTKIDKTQGKLTISIRNAHHPVLQPLSHTRVSHK